MKTKYQPGEKLEALINGHIVTIKILKVKINWFGITLYLCEYGTNHRHDGVYMYDTIDFKWVRESNIIDINRSIE